MSVKVIILCTLLILSGCIQYNPSQSTDTANSTPSAKDRIEESAKTPSSPNTLSEKYDADTESIEGWIHRKVNDRRIEHNATPLQHSDKLDKIGRYKSWHMAEKNYFAHSSPWGMTHSNLRYEFNSTCGTAGQNIYRVRYNPEMVNIQYQLRQEEEIATGAVNALMNSTGHRENILNPAYDVQGIGVYVDENGTVFVTQEFCGY